MKQSKLIKYLNDIDFSDEQETKERMRLLIDVWEREEKGEEVIIDEGSTVWVRVDEIVDLVGCKKSKDEFLPYYDIAAMREGFNNPDYKWRTDFRFTKDVHVDIRDGRPYIDNGALSEVGDLLLSTQGTLGETFTTKERCYITESLKKVVFKYDIVMPEFFVYWVEHKKEQILKANQSSMIPSLNRPAFNRMLLPIPHKQIQAAIVYSLNKLKDHIDETEERIKAENGFYEATRNEIFKEIDKHKQGDTDD